MSAALLDQGKTAIRDVVKTLVTHVGISTDTTAFSSSQVRIDPTGAGTNIIKSSAGEVNVDAGTFDAPITISGADGVGVFKTVSILNGASATNALTRSVRTNGIGIDVGDTFVLTVRVTVEDNS